MHHGNRLADPTFDLRSFSDSQNLCCDMSYKPEFDFPSNEVIIRNNKKFLLNDYNFVTGQKGDDFGQYS